MTRLFSCAALAALLLGAVGGAQAMDLTVGAGQSSESTTVARIGLQFDWGTSWWQSDTGRLTGYWDAGYTYWDGESGSTNHSLAFAPVFVYEFAGDAVRPYLEAGIGVAAFADTTLEGRELGSSFQFEDRIGAGLRFGQDQEVGLRAIHYSNAGLKEPNDGIESISLHYRLGL
ncbi:MAG: acyloxyacyl hydrolase [Pseudomonas sp.]|uniref:acyloxyacyl hydrolase n=1 Tax=Pseudomonas sp. TaxID=306 RepID=UPI003391381C